LALPKKIVLDDGGKRSLKKLPQSAQRLVLKKLCEYNEKPQLIASNVKQLTDTTPPKTRLRIGDYRGVGIVVGDTLYINIIIDRKDLERSI